MRKWLLCGVVAVLGAAVAVLWTDGPRTEAGAEGGHNVALAATASSASSASGASAVSAVSGTGVASSTSSSTVSSSTTVPAGYQVVAQDSVLRMAVDMTSCVPDPGCNYGNMQILDKQDGVAWYSTVPNPTEYAVNQYQQGVLASDILVGYTTEERTKTSAPPENPWQGYGQSGASLSVSMIPNGVALTYQYLFVTPITVTMDVVLSGNEMTVTIPYTQIKQPSCPRYAKPEPLNLLTIIYIPPECDELTEITVMPAFGSQVPGTPGYLVLPDGSGALVNFSVDHPPYSTPYNADVYGDPTITPSQDSWGAEDNMPIFGIYNQQEQAGLLGVVSEGASDSQITLVPASQQASLYSARVTFVYRGISQQLVIGTTPTEKYNWKITPGNRQITYYFLSGSQATYNGMAQQFRQYLISEQNAKPLKPQAAPPFMLQVLNGIRSTGVLFDPFNAMTTFAQTKDMLVSLKDAGVNAVRVTLEGWQVNGLNWKTEPENWPPAGQLGGTSGLKSLTDWANANGDQVVLETNMYEGYQSRDGFNVRADSIHDQDGLITVDYAANGRAFLISPDVAENTLFPPLVKDAKDLGIAGFDFNYLGRNVWSNWNPKHLLTRSQSAKDWMKMVAVSTNQLGTGGVQGGNTYSIGSANYLYNVPTSDNGYVYESQSIPFWEMAVHGLALYTGVESNLSSDPTQQYLDSIEYGALPIWELTWQPSSALVNTSYAELYSSQFSQWEQQAVADYKQELSSGYAALAYVPIISNESIAPGVTETDYANGARVLVNFTTQAYASPYGVTVPAENYVVVGGGGTNP